MVRIYGAAVYEKALCGKESRNHNQQLPVTEYLKVSLQLLTETSRLDRCHDGSVISNDL